MINQGSFGYKIGRKTRLMNVQYDADILWQTCVREIFILMKHFGSIELLREAFENIREVKHKHKLTSDAINKCSPYSDLRLSNKKIDEWTSLTKNCQHSFINILDSGYFLNNGEKVGFIFILDFNTYSVRFYYIDNNKEKEYEKATIDEIMNFEDMPIKSYIEIIRETKERYDTFYKKLKCIDDEIDKINIIINKAKELGEDQNILQQTKYLLCKVKSERATIEEQYNYFYHRLDSLNLISHDNN